METMLNLLLCALMTANIVAPQVLYTQHGSDPSFEEVIKSGGIKPGVRFSKGPVYGSRIDVNNEHLEKMIGKTGPIPDKIRIHTQGAGGIQRKDFHKWTRWYQEDGSTQIFRLFKGEQNIRGGVDKDGSPGRIEAFIDGSLTGGPNKWHEWEGTYTIVKPTNACIFQLMHEGYLWPFHIDMNEKGDVFFSRRRPISGMRNTIPIGEHMTGTPFSVKVIANGYYYKVYVESPHSGRIWRLLTTGFYHQAQKNEISFRWGMYSGSQKGEKITNDALLFVTGFSFK